MPLLVILALLVGCDYRHVKVNNDGSVAPNSKALANPDYETVRSVVISKRCNSCHSAEAGIVKGSVSLDNYDEVLAKQSRIYARAILDTEKPMPPEGLSAGDKQLLQVWLANGAPKKVAPGEAEDPALDKGTLNFQKIKEKIFDKRQCSGCHSGPTPDGKLDLTSYAQVSANVGPIYESIFVKKNMPPTPLTKLTSKERSVLLMWFEAGLPQ